MKLDPFYFATENLHGEFFNVGTTGDDRYCKPLPRGPVEIGWSEDGGFPGVFIGAKSADGGLLCAAASQVRFQIIFRFRGWNGQDAWAFEIEEHTGGIEDIQLAPGESVAGEKLFFGLAPTSDPQASTAAYDRFLRANGFFKRRDKFNVLSTQRIWCSWNYDFYSRINEDAVLRQLPVLKQNFPWVKFVQVDDGYQQTYRNGPRAQIDFLYRAKEPFDRRKFPHGMKALAGDIQAAGLRPALWLGLWAAHASPMIRNHPDWVLRDDMGAPMLIPRPKDGDTCVLDPSVPAVRRYLDDVFRTVIVDWGFEGIKLDFSSFAFESKRARFRNPGTTALQWRDWLAQTIRRYLPRDGFLGWCVVASAGNPFLASDADYFRCAVDITYEHSANNWATIRRIAGWCANSNVLLADRPVLPNIDSIGWNRSFSETDWSTWLNLAAVSGAALEVSGDLTKLSEAKLKRLNQTLELSDPSRRVWCADLAEADATKPPAVWIAEGKTNALVALFNWSERSVSLDSLIERVPSLRTGTRHDAWTGARRNLSGRLRPHESILVEPTSVRLLQSRDPDS